MLLSTDSDNIIRLKLYKYMYLVSLSRQPKIIDDVTSTLKRGMGKFTNGLSEDGIAFEPRWTNTRKLT